MDVRGVQEKSFTKLGRILKVPDSGILGGGVALLLQVTRVDEIFTSDFF